MGVMPEMSWGALAVAIAAGEDADSLPIVAIVANRSDTLADISRCRAAPIITATVGDHRSDTRTSVDLALSDSDVDEVVAAVSGNPEAAATLALLLRATAEGPIQDAIQCESLAYATLQSGNEFARWLAGRGRVEPAVPSPQPVIVRQDAVSTLLVLNRPESANALDATMRHSLVSALSALAFSDGPIVLEGGGRHFCAGGDLREFGLTEFAATSHLRRMKANLPLAFARVAERMTVRVHGACIGAGMELSSFASRVVATSDTHWRLPEVGMGLIPGCGGTVSVTRRIGRQRLLQVALTGESIDASRALRWGLVDEILS